MADARAIRSIHDSAVGADDVHDAPVSQRARPHFMRLQTLRIASGDVAPQPLRDRRTKLGRDARLWMFQKWKNRRCIFKSVTYDDQSKSSFLSLRSREGGKDNYIYLPVKIISGRHNRSIEPGTRLFLKIDRENNQSVHRDAHCTVRVTPNAHLSQKFLAFSIFC
jgi:hypothetical protein